MSKRGNGDLADTVSNINDVERVIQKVEKTHLSFCYKEFCKRVMKVSKRKGDACLLVPLKMYHDEKGVQEIEFLSRLEKWMGTFSKKRDDFFYIWIYLVYDQGYINYKDWNAGIHTEKIVSANVVKNAGTYVGDVSKLEKNIYIKKLCEQRDDVELWILNAYEITLKKIYPVTKMALLMEGCINYLRECGIKINKPGLGEPNERENHIFQIAANLMLFVTRLHLGIDVQRALEWYRNGNVAYSLYENRMMEEYMRLVDQYFYQSYERLIKMQNLASVNKNKYAAKEVGDAYRIGIELQDCHGNKILIEANQEMACEYYRICMDFEYIPAYVPAVNTGVLINAEQKRFCLEEAKEKDNPEGVVYYAASCINDADKYVQSDFEKSLVLLKDAVKSISVLEDTYGEKHVLKNKILLSKTFEACKDSKAKIEEDFYDVMQKLYSENIFDMNNERMLSEIEKTYLLAKEQGYFEAEYKLGLLFQESNSEKSEKYFEQGKEKGCKRCMLEYARMKKEENPEEWLQIMMYLGRGTYDDQLLVMIAKEWADSEKILEQICIKVIELEINELMEIYLVIYNLFTSMYKRKGDDVGVVDKMNENIRLMMKLSSIQENLKELIFKTD